MRVFALSDVHIDYDENRRWIAGLSAVDYKSDLLILAGDICDSIPLLTWCLETLVRRFARVLFVPGNHELWVHRDQTPGNSLDKFQQVCQVIESSGASMRPFHSRSLSIVPLLAWYDYSFGEPSPDLLNAWTDFVACRWPEQFPAHRITNHFLQLNEDVLRITNQKIISFSHFVPRLDLMPNYTPGEQRFLYPVLGSTGLEAQIRRLHPAIHVYGHSHLNRKLMLDDVLYINNAFGYPHETSFTARQLVCVYEE